MVADQFPGAVDPAPGHICGKWDTLLAVDSDKWAAATYRANFPSVRVECGPVSDFISALPDADVILGGPPCQPFSDAGENESVG